jgi:hypothetical protein
MHTATLSLDTLIRPRLLIVSARHGLNDYNRASLLARLLGLPLGRRLPEPKVALAQLAAREVGLEAARRHHDASWRAADHVAVLTAMLHEAHTLNGMRAERVPTSSDSLHPKELQA